MTVSGLQDCKICETQATCKMAGTTILHILQT